MDSDVLLQQLRNLPLEEGRAYIQEHIEELSDHIAIAKLLEDEALHVLYTPFLSLKLAELLIFYGEYTGHLPSHALGLKAKGDALRYIGHHQAAIECLDVAGAEFLSLKDECNWARSRISWITASTWLGQIEEALHQASLARNIFLRHSEYYWVCIIDSNVAVIYEQLGRYQDAIRLYEGTLGIYPTLADQNPVFIKRAIAIAKNNQAVNLSFLGRFEQAYLLLNQAQIDFTDLGETSMGVNSEVNLADLDYIQGYYGSALRRYYLARDNLIHNEISDPLLLAELKLLMASCLVKLNRVEEAYRLAGEAVEMYRQSDISLSLGEALRQYTSILVVAGKIKEALVALDEAEKLFVSGRFDPFISAIKLQRVELLLELGYFTEAYEGAKHIKEYFENQGLVIYTVKANLVMATAVIAKIQQIELLQSNTLPDEVLYLCRQVSLQARQHNLQEELYKCHHLLGRLFASQGNVIKATKHYESAITQIEYILDDLVYDLSPSFLHTAWNVYKDMVVLCLQQSQFEQAFNYLERARSIALRQYLGQSSNQLKRYVKQGYAGLIDASQANSVTLLRIQQELKSWQENYRYYSTLLREFDNSVSSAVDREVIYQEIKRCEAKISELFERLQLHQTSTNFTNQYKKPARRKVTSIDIEQLRQRLVPEQLLLAYFFHKDSLFIFAVTKEQMVVYENAEGVVQLEYLLPLLYDAHLQYSGWSDSQRPPQKVIRRLLKKLYDLLIAPVASLLPPSSGALTIVPYGMLHKLPFHALYNGSHFLIEDFQVSYLPASSILMSAKNDEGQQYNRSSEVEVPVKLPLVFGYSGNNHLQQVQEEARIIASRLDGRCFLEGEATIAQLIKESPGSAILHLATHGRSRLDAPNFSYVQLADGQLNAIDAFGMDLRRCELVTLSGCETGLALSGGGDEQLGLGRAFLAAGADSLVMSLWQVEDNATNELMQIFYTHLLNGESKIQALRNAQCHLLHQSESAYTHPYFWAAFRLVGEVGPLKYKR